MTTSFARPTGEAPALHPDIEAARARREEAMARAVDAQLFAVLGLDASWTGTRWLGGSGVSNGGVVNYLELGHGDPRDRHAPLVRVGAHADRSEPADAGPHTARRLATQLWHEGADHELVQPSFSAADPLAKWDRRTIPVDGQPVMFRYLAAGRAWAAFAQLGGRLVTVFARNVTPDDVRLSRVTDPEPYRNRPGPTS